MPVQSVNFANFKPDLNPICTKVTYTSKPALTTQEPKEEGMSNTSKASIGAGILGTALLAGWLIYRGKIKAAESTGTNLSEQIQKLNITDFKAKGKFKKGKAILDRKGFTGKIEVPVSDTRKVGATITYKDGILQKSVLTNGVTKKYTDEGKIFGVCNPSTNETILFRRNADNEVRKLVFVPDGGKISEVMDDAVSAEKELSKKAIPYDKLQFDESGNTVLFEGKPFTGVVLKEDAFDVLPDGMKAKTFAPINKGVFCGKVECYMHDNSGKLKYCMNVIPENNEFQLVSSDFIWSGDANFSGDNKILVKDGCSTFSAAGSILKSIKKLTPILKSCNM